VGVQVKNPWLILDALIEEEFEFRLSWAKVTHCILWVYTWLKEDMEVVIAKSFIELARKLFSLAV
jgi:hypothetical protein